MLDNQLGGALVRNSELERENHDLWIQVAKQTLNLLNAHEIYKATVSFAINMIILTGTACYENGVSQGRKAGDMEMGNFP